MPLKDPRKGPELPYMLVQKGSEPGCYCLHRPSECYIKFPPTNRPLHKCEVPKKEITMVPQDQGYRKLIVPSQKKNLYPCIMDRTEYNRLKERSKYLTPEQQEAARLELEESQLKAVRESEERKNQLKRMQKKQPGVTKSIDDDAESAGLDEIAANLTRAEAIMADRLPCAAAANRVILATKCRMIRDAQLAEKEMLTKAYRDEELRLDAIMEENRQAAIKREADSEAKRKELLLNNLDAVKTQIDAHEAAKIMEAERIEEESIRTNQANIAMQIDEVNKLKKRQEEQLKLKKMLDECNAELVYYKQLQMEEERLIEERNKKFFREKHEREEKTKKEAEAAKAAKQKDIASISANQKAEQALKEELERIRNLRIQEEVEREYRKKEKLAAEKRKADLEHLHRAREQQIKDIHRNIARELAKDEQDFHNAAKQNEEYLRRTKEEELKKLKQLEKHRQDIIEQIRQNEKFKLELRDRQTKEGDEIRASMKNIQELEKSVTKQKIAELRKQGIPEKYVGEVEANLRKQKCI